MKETKAKKEADGAMKTQKARNAAGYKPNLMVTLMVMSVVPLLLSILLVSVVTSSLMKKMLNESSREKLFVTANNLANHCQQYHIGMKNANQYYDYLDSLKDRNIQMSIIIGDKLVVSSIKNENEYRVREIPYNGEEYKEYYDEGFEIDGVKYVGYYVPFESDDGDMCYALAAEPKAVVMKSGNALIRNLVLVAAMLAAVFTVLAFLLGRILMNAFLTLEKGINALSDGDLSEITTKAVHITELDNLMNNTKAMQQSLSATIGGAKKISADLVTRIEEVSEHTGSTYSRANQIDEVVTNLTEATNSMTENIQDINHQVIEIGNAISDIYQNVGGLNENSEGIMRVNDQTSRDMARIKENSDRSLSAVQNIASQIEETNRSIAEIDTAVDLIISISDQTNLLSLNASIEAARAGEFGRGFAVVAEEIRSLSEQSGEGAEIIRKLAQKIETESEKTVSLAGQVLALIQEGSSRISMTQEQYEELSCKIRQSVEEIRSLMRKTDELSGYKEQIVGNIHDLSAISEENAASHHEVNFNIAEIVSEMKQVNDNCRSMNDMAQELKNAVEYFKV